MPKRKGPNEGMIRQRSDGRWEARLSVGWAGGKRKTKCLYGKTQGDVRAKLVASQKDVIDGLPLLEEKQTIATFMEYWLESIVKPVRKPSTYRLYRVMTDQHITPDLGRYTLVKLTPQILQKYLAGQKSSRHIRITLRSALSHAERQDLVKRNVAKLVLLPSNPKREVTAFSIDQANQLLVAAKKESDGALFILAVLTGLRQGEILGLNWSDIDFATGALSVRRQIQLDSEGKSVVASLKTKASERTVYLPELAIESLRALKGQQLVDEAIDGPMQSPFVFRSEKGTPVDASKVRKRLTAILETAKLPKIRFHDLRHTAATLLKSAGADIQTVKDQLGHSQISLTANTYTHWTNPTMKAASTQMQGLFDVHRKKLEEDKQNPST